MGHPHLEFLRWWLSFFQGRNPSVSFGAVLITKLLSGLHYTLCTPDLCGPWQLSRDRVEREQWEGGKPIFQGKSKQHSGDLSLFLLTLSVPKESAVCFNPKFQGWHMVRPFSPLYLALPCSLCLSSVLFHCSLRKWT